MSGIFRTCAKRNEEGNEMAKKSKKKDARQSEPVTNCD